MFRGYGRRGIPGIKVFIVRHVSQLGEDRKSKRGTQLYVSV